MADFYEAMQQGFGWQVPEHFNMAEVCSRRWAAQPDAAHRVATSSTKRPTQPGTPCLRAPTPTPSCNKPPMP